MRATDRSTGSLSFPRVGWCVHLNGCAEVAAARATACHLAKKRSCFETRYYVGLNPEDALRLPTKNLTMRTTRHTCITLNHDAGAPRELIRAITGHEPDAIDQVLNCYAAVTADQAAAAPTWRIEHEERIRTKMATSALPGAQDASRDAQELQTPTA